MIKCTCGCDPEVCACAFQPYHVPPPADTYDDDDDFCIEPLDLNNLPHEMPTDDE